MISDLNKSIRSLMSFRDIFVDRKRIQFTSKLTEGTLEYYWNIIRMLLGCYWDIIRILLGCRWVIIGMWISSYYFIASFVGVFGVMYDGFLSNTEDDVEGAIPVIIKTVKGNPFSIIVTIGL